MHSPIVIRRPLLRRWLAPCLFLLALLLPTFAVAQGIPGLSSADQTDIRNFTLNEDVFNRLQSVVTEGRAMHIKRMNVDMSKVSSLDEMADQMMAADPRTKALLSKHGFAPRQFLVANLALASTVMTMRYAEQTGQADAMTGQLNPANVKFYEEHKAAIDKMMTTGQQPAAQQ